MRRAACGCIPTRTAEGAGVCRRFAIGRVGRRRIRSFHSRLSVDVGEVRVLRCKMMWAVRQIGVVECDVKIILYHLYHTKQIISKISRFENSDSSIYRCFVLNWTLTLVFS
jgi:hypothetical protein